MAESKALIDRMMRMVRDLAMGLRPSMLDDLGLEPALAWQAREFSRRYNVPVDLASRAISSGCPTRSAPASTASSRKRLTNCAKHSAATEIPVQVVRRADAARRVGARQRRRHGLDDRPQGAGLTGIKERVKEINGSTSIQTRPGGGTVVYITLPVPAADSSKEDLVANSAR